ncbi:MAG: c-type cytochrome [Caldimonas sp.]
MRHPGTHGAWIATAGLALALLSSGSASGAVPAASTSGVEAGKYLAEAAHCSACHTSHADRPFAGNLAIPSRFGTMYSSNITPDAKTGIGAWTETEFASALRLGKGRHGRYLYPSMPYTDFTKISDADVHALWLYFRSVAPIAEAQKPNEMKFPFNVRPGIAAWQALYFKPGRYVPDSSQSAEWNRGAYLVQGLGHCGACHTPKNFAMADKTGRGLQGASTGDNWFAPNIGGGRFSGIRDWSPEQIVDFLKTGHNDKNVAAVGPMLETIAQGTQHLAAADLQAIAVYLKNQDAGQADTRPASVELDANRRAAGAAVYANHCTACHGDDGKGLDGVAPALAGNSAVTSAGPQTVVHAILSGFAPNGRWGAMPSFASVLDSQEIVDVTNYARTAWGGQASADATVAIVNRMSNEVETGDPRIQAALICPSVPAASLDPQTVDEIGALARREGDVQASHGLVSNYRRRHPEVERSEVVNVLSGLYCRDLMAIGTGSAIDKQMRVIRFTARVAGEDIARRR